MTNLFASFQFPFSHLFPYIYQHYQYSYHRKLKYDQNSVQFTTAFSIVFLYLIYLIIAQLSFSYTLTIIFSLAFTAIFVLLASRVITHFDSVVIAFLSISSPVIVSHFQNNIFISFLVISLGPVFTLLLTNSYKCFIASTLLHIIDMNTKFRENLLSKLYILDCSDHELFVNQAFITVSIQIIFSMCIYGVMDRVSQKCIVELTEKDQGLHETKLNNFKLLEDVCAQITHPLKYLYGIIDFAMPQVNSIQIIDTFKQIQTTLKVFKNDMDNLLVYEKLRFQEIDIEPIPTRTYDWLSEIWTISSDLIRDKGSSGFLKVQRKVPSLLYLDSRRVQQVILNLLQFTLENTKKGLVNLTIEWLDSESVTDRCFEPIPYNYEEEGVFEKKEALHIFDINNQDKTLDRFQIFKNQEREIKFENCNFSQKIPFGTLKLTVRNTGAGLSDKEVNEIFDEDRTSTPNNDDETRLEDNRKEAIKKRPLKISRDICTKMDGDLRAYSKKDVGMTFMACFPIPMYQSWQIQSGIRAKVTKLRKIKPKALTGNNDPGLTSQITHYLKSLDGYIVKKETTVSEFFVTLSELSLESQRPFELVIIDLGLPHLDVVAFCERLRNVERKSQLGPLSILLTGEGEVNDVIQSLLNKNHPGHVNKYLKKPFEFYEFLDAILHIC